MVHQSKIGNRKIHITILKKTKMKVTKPKVIIESDVDGDIILGQIEKAVRTAYKSEDKISPNSHVNFVKKIIDLGHLSVLEHQTITV